MSIFIIDKLKQHFEKDLLYIYLQKWGLEDDQLFPAFLYQLSLERVYSTMEVAEMFEMKDSNLRYQMKMMREIDYLGELRAGRNYRFDYLNIYRMYLVVTILNIPGRNTGDIEFILMGKSLEVYEEEKEIAKIIAIQKEVANAHNQTINDLDIQILEKQTLINELQIKVIEMYKDFLILDQKFNLNLLEIEITEKVSDVVKQSNKKWLMRSNEQEISNLNTESSQQLRILKDEVSLSQSNISEIEKRISIESFEFRKLLEEKKRILVIGH
ncbi:hypothetical protein JFL43_20575 [Viridibacillus sp. YIM B01967]|uniref:Uncharacterized protein n=1 Tax=Viridibacillus soli TaxID=2798301 RepID=A0ABS1HCP2_9BACL|nr:hypothetical protein [Viridibacillus soli]MBK3497179.1 hypothetical protein [Viridibacillus soli]